MLRLCDGGTAKGRGTDAVGTVSSVTATGAGGKAGGGGSGGCVGAGIEGKKTIISGCTGREVFVSLICAQVEHIGLVKAGGVGEEGRWRTTVMFLPTYSPSVSPIFR